MINCLVVHVGMDVRVLAKVWGEHETIVRLYHRTAMRLMSTEAAAGDLEYRAVVAVRPAFKCRAEQVAVGVGDQAAERKATVGPVTVDRVEAEAEQGGGGAGVAGSRLSDLEHRAVLVRPAPNRCAEQVAVGVGDQGALRIKTVGAVEVDQGGGGAGVAVGGLGDFEYRADVVRPAECRCAEQVAVGISDQAAERIVTVGVVEADQGGGGAGVAVGGLDNLEYRAVAVGPAYGCRAEQVAVGVGDQAAERTGTVGVVEADQGGGAAGIAVGGLGDLEDRALVVRPAPNRCAEQVAVGVGDQGAVRRDTVGVVEADQGGRGAWRSRGRSWRSRTPCRRRSPRRILLCRTGRRGRRRSGRPPGSHRSCRRS
jgi:hypothetical protein